MSYDARLDDTRRCGFQRVDRCPVAASSCRAGCILCRIYVVAPREDFSHSSMEWSSSLGALVSRPSGGGVAFRAALAVGDLRLLLLEGKGSDRIAAEYELAGHTIDQAYSWLQQAIEDFTKTPLAAGLVRPPHKIPQHRVGGGQLFSSDPGETFEEWARWFDNSAGVLWDIQEVTAHASPVRCWPHHFDIATLVQLEPGNDPESGASIGIACRRAMPTTPSRISTLRPGPTPRSPACRRWREAASGTPTAGWGQY